jgi:protein TonB
MDRLLLAEELLDLAERTQMHTRATGSAIALPLGEKLVIRTSTGIAPEVGASLPIGEGTIGQCARIGKPYNVSGEDKMDAALRPLDVQSLIAVPIHHAGIFYGVLVALAQSPEAFTRIHVAIMMTMGNEVARVLKRMEAVALEFAPGIPLRPSPAPVAAPAENVVPILRPAPATPTAPQNIVETLKAIEQKPAPMKLATAPPLAPRLSPPPVTKTTAPNPAQQMAALSFIELDTAPPPPQPLPDLLCPGEDPRQWGTLKNAKSLETQPTFACSSAYPRPASSSHKKVLTVAVLVIAAAAFGMWRHGEMPAMARAAVSADEPAAASLAVKKATASLPAVLRTVAPIYPELARRSGTYGDVRLQLTVSPAGKVTDIRVLDGAAILRQAATNAVSQWQYRPATLDGRAVESTVDVAVKFAPR